MSKARLVITAIEVEGRSPAEVVAAYGVSRSWLYELLARYRAGGDAAFEPRSRRPHSSPRSTPAQTVELVLRIRKQLRATAQRINASHEYMHIANEHDDSHDDERIDEQSDKRERRTRSTNVIENSMS